MDKTHKSVAARAAIAEALLGKHTGTSQGKKPLPDPKLKVRPMGGLKPHGLKASLTYKF